MGFGDRPVETAEMMTFEEAVAEWSDMTLEVREVIMRLDTETGKTKVMKVLRRAEKDLNDEIIETA